MRQKKPQTSWPMCEGKAIPHIPLIAPFPQWNMEVVASCRGAVLSVRTRKVDTSDGAECKTGWKLFDGKTKIDCGGISHSYNDPKHTTTIIDWFQYKHVQMFEWPSRSADPNLEFMQRLENWLSQILSIQSDWAAAHAKKNGQNVIL